MQKKQRRRLLKSESWFGYISLLYLIRVAQFQHDKSDISIGSDKTDAVIDFDLGALLFLATNRRWGDCKQSISVNRKITHFGCVFY